MTSNRLLVVAVVLLALALGVHVIWGHEVDHGGRTEAAKSEGEGKSNVTGVEDTSSDSADPARESGPAVGGAPTNGGHRVWQEPVSTSAGIEAANAARAINESLVDKAAKADAEAKALEGKSNGLNDKVDQAQGALTAEKKKLKEVNKALPGSNAAGNAEAIQRAKAAKAAVDAAQVALEEARLALKAAQRSATDARSLADEAKLKATQPVTLQGQGQPTNNAAPPSASGSTQ